MINRRISHAKGKGSLNHNNRNHFYKNVDPEKTKNNTCYMQESLEEAYQKCFGEALENYNAKQKRSDRKIDDYYKHLFGNTRKDVVATSSNKEKSFYEIVVGIGDKNSCPVGSADGELAAKILDEYAKSFSERNPNFYVFNSVMHLDEKTPHLHIDYIPIADGYKNGLAIRNSQSAALQQMGFGKDKNSINEWRKHERKILKEICKKYDLVISEETQGRGKTFTPDEYKKIRDETKAELKSDPEILEETRAELENELMSEQQFLADEILKFKNEMNNLQDKKTALQNEIKQEQKNFKNLQTQFKPRKEDLKKLNRIKKGVKSSLLNTKITLPKDDWAFIMNIAEQHAKISDITISALENQKEITETLKRCQSLYLAVALEVVALGNADRSNLTQNVKEVLKDIEDTRIISWLIDDMVNQKPSDLAELIKSREGKINKKHSIVKKLRDYNQTNLNQKKTNKQSPSHER